MSSEPNNPCQQFREQVGADPDLAVPAGETAEHLRSCPDCVSWLTQMQGLRDRLGAVQAPTLPAGFHRSLTARLRDAAQPSPEAGNPFWFQLVPGRTALAGVAVAAVALVALFLVFRTDSGAPRDDHGVLVDLHIEGVEPGRNLTVEVQLPRQLVLASSVPGVREADTLRWSSTAIGGELHNQLGLEAEAAGEGLIHIKAVSGEQTATTTVPVRVTEDQIFVSNNRDLMMEDPMIRELRNLSLVAMLATPSLAMASGMTVKAHGDAVPLDHAEEINEAQMPFLLAAADEDDEQQHARSGHGQGQGGHDQGGMDPEEPQEESGGMHGGGMHGGGMHGGGGLHDMHTEMHPDGGMMGDMGEHGGMGDRGDDGGMGDHGGMGDQGDDPGMGPDDTTMHPGELPEAEPDDDHSGDMGDMGDMGNMGDMGDHPCMEPEDLDDGGMMDHEPMHDHGMMDGGMGEMGDQGDMMGEGMHGDAGEMEGDCGMMGMGGESDTMHEDHMGGGDDGGHMGGGDDNGHMGGGNDDGGMGNGNDGGHMGD